jgi:hypothetical protein
MDQALIFCPERFEFFGDVVSRFFPVEKHKQTRFADIGSGYPCSLQKYLRSLGYEKVVSFDDYIVNNQCYSNINRYFTVTDGEDFDVLLGLNPCDGTETIIRCANNFRLPIVIRPCCPKNKFLGDNIRIIYKRKKDWSSQETAWTEFLAKKLQENGFKIYLETTLESNGLAFTVIIGFPK